MRRERGREQQGWPQVLLRVTLEQVRGSSVCEVMFCCWKDLMGALPVFVLFKYLPSVEYLLL